MSKPPTTKGKSKDRTAEDKLTAKETANLKQNASWLPWLPIGLVALLVFFATILIQSIIYAILRFFTPVTHGWFLITLAISLTLAFLIGLIVRRKSKENLAPPSKS